MSDAVSPAGSSRIVRETPVARKPTKSEASKRKRDATAPGTRKPSSQKRARSLPAWVEAGKPVGKGPRQLAWIIYVWLRLYKVRWIPQPRPHGLYLRRALATVKTVRALRKETMAIVSVMTTKGGATKTTISTWLAAVLMWIYKLQVMVLDIDTGGGKATRRFQLDPSKTLESRKVIGALATNEDWFLTYEDLVPRLEADSETGVMVFHCEETDDQTKRQSISDALPVLKTACHTMVVDTGPGFEKKITEGAEDVATVTCVVGRPHSEEELNDIAKTLDHEAYGLREKGKSVLVVISGIRWFNYNTRMQYRYAEMFGIEPEQVVLMPYVRYLFKVRHVNIGKLTPKALFAQVSLAEAVAKAALRYNAANPSAPIEEFDTVPTAEEIPPSVV